MFFFFTKSLTFHSPPPCYSFLKNIHPWISDDTSDIIMDDNIQLRRHQTQAARQPTVTQRLSDILRNRRLKIGGRSNTTTASSLSDSLTLSESNTHSSAHRNVRWGDILLACSSLLKVVPVTIYCAHSSTKIIS